MSSLDIHPVQIGAPLNLPFAEEGVRAGFPSPAQNYMGESIDLNKYLIEHAESTFYARVTGDSLCDAGVEEGDILIVDKSLTPRNGDMAVCCVGGEFTLKYLEVHSDYILLLPANYDYAPIRVEADEYFTVWGIVTYIIHKARKRR